MNIEPDASIQFPSDFKPPFVAETKSYTNHEGLTIQELIPIYGLIPRGHRFRAMAAIMLDGANGPIPHQFMFSYDAVDVSEAFTNFKEEADKAAVAERDRVLAEIRRQNLSLGSARRRQ